MNDAPNSPSRVRADAETAFVLGNGPSLANVSLPSLSPYATIGMNAAYRYWRQIDWRPRFYACVDLVVGMSHRDEIAALINEGRIEAFLLRSNLIEALGRTARTQRVVNFDAVRATCPSLSINPPTTGSHAALWAASMGYRKVCVLGVDGRYKEIVDGARRGDGIELEIVEARQNPNYFFSDYQQPGDRYNVPNPRPELHLNAWRLAAARLKRENVDAFNGNSASAVRCLPFVDLAAFLGDGAEPAPPDETVEDFANESSVAPAPSGLRDRVKAFRSAYGVPFAALALAIGAMLALWTNLTAPSPALFWAALAGVGAALAFAFGALYTRFAILRQLSRQDDELSGLRARIADLERLSQRHIGQ